MKIPVSVLLPLAACLLHAGCYSLVSASSKTLNETRVAGTVGQPREHVVVSNRGWYLFNTYPLVCGNAKPGAKFPFVFFRDDVTTDLLHGRLTDYAAKRNARVAELNLFFDDTVLFTIPLSSISIPLPYVICYHERTVSGLLMEEPSALPAPAPVPSSAVPVSADSQRKDEMNRLLEKIPDGGVR